MMASYAFSITIAVIAVCGWWLRKPVGSKNIVCPYHAWCYGLDGQLIRIPHRHGFGRHAVEPGDPAGLEEVRCTVWIGIVFVDLGGTAGEFSEFVAPLANRWAHFDFSPFGSRHEYDF